MIVIVDSREIVRNGFKGMFMRLGYPSVGLSDCQLEDWLDAMADSDIQGVKAFLMGKVEDDDDAVGIVRRRSKAPLIAVLDQSSLPDMLGLFDKGADDVVKKPVHVTEILARAAAIRRRQVMEEPKMEFGDLRVFTDGRDPLVGDVTLALPRRERRILEFLASIGDRRATRSQIYNAVYGVLEHEVDECVVESHISKLRKKLKNVLGYDIIDSKRFLGYRLLQNNPNTITSEKTDTNGRSFRAGSDVSLAQASTVTV